MNQKQEKRSVKIVSPDDPQFKPNHAKRYALEGDSIVVEIEDSKRGFFWRMTVNGSKSPVSSHYPGVMNHAGYRLASAYWDGVFDEFVPFRVKHATEAK